MAATLSVHHYLVKMRSKSVLQLEGAPTGLIPILECYFNAEMGKKEMSGKLVAFLTHVNDFGERREPIPKFSGLHLPWLKVKHELNAYCMHCQ